MRYLAKYFPGAVLVLATLRKGLTSREIVEITRIAKAGRRYWKPDHPVNPVLILTGTELLHWLAPPGCWDDDTKKRFDRTLGLLALCDASQQLYLNLPSWQSEWHKHWEQKAARRRAKQHIREGRTA
jgi:hypothetical protein